MVNPYKTHWYHRQPQFWLDRDPHRPVGANRTPEVIRLDPVAGHAPSDQPVVRIFLGTEPRQYRGTRIFVWSVMQHRDPARAYEITLMSDLDGIPREGWKTGFTNYRYAIPHLAGNAGRAIYNDVDQIYLADPAEMFDLDMQGKGVLAISEKENSVMLIDCEVMAEHWTLEAVKAGEGHAHFKGVMSGNGLYGELPGVWNSRDGEHPVPQIKCLHYTTLHTQPWKPFPEMLRYGESPVGYIWHDMEKAADEAGYLMFDRAHPSVEYTEVAASNAPAPAPALDVTGEVRALAADAGTADVAAFVRAGEAHDGIGVSGVLEALPPLDVPWMLDDAFAAARRFVVVGVECKPSGTAAAEGRPPRSTELPAHWWRTQMELAARRHPDLRWRLVVREGKRHSEVFDASGPSVLA